MPTIVIYQIDADPLGVSDVTILNAFTVDITDDDALLEGNDGSGLQLDDAGLSGLLGTSNSFQVFETYSGFIGGSSVSFTLLQFSSPVYIVATVGSFSIGDTITGTGGTIITAPPSTYTALPDYVCFAAGSMVETPGGPRAIETLVAGDLVLTDSGCAKPVRWVGRRHLGADELAENPHLRPVLIAPCAFGPGVPSRAVRVSPQHRVALGSGAAGIALQSDAVLVPAKCLTGRSGIEVDRSVSEVDYFHILFDAHELVNVAGLWSETLFLGDTTIAGLSDDAHSEISQLFPQFEGQFSAFGSTCLPVVTTREAQVALHDFCAYVPDVDSHPRVAAS